MEKNRSNEKKIETKYFFPTGRGMLLFFLGAPICWKKFFLEKLKRWKKSHVEWQARPALGNDIESP